MRWCTAAGVTGALLVALAQPAAAEVVVDQEEVRAEAMAMAPDPEYLADAEPAARAVAAEYGIPASVTAGQSVLESGWGRSALAVNHRNYFGFKCTSAGPGPIAVGCAEYPTTECQPECAPTVAAFRVYESMTDSFRDYGRLITTSPYYADALPHADDPDRFVTEVAKRYATDPRYAEKVIALMVQHDLYRLDSPE
ncbi:glucosaminidase domain-containing protein [Actinokineospora sp. UTMC 2448]|uniref:glucosaminidase domain-containing protein n=1 Tax=Actinokineospora sp. UTMC 2448 TaxID=2268449 RepID=UPI00216455E7|nr:glucosaminidase domain-containing protein [Actinokineospora sp. UTMC 2448]UVS76450.1 Peptidoglycan hydrolase FlgJ [Actinokineospora sp. UTMC 2448]